jgi:hypothetical protein
MGLTMKERKSFTAMLMKRYRRASKKQKGRMLEEFVALTGYHRWYAVWLLRGHGVRLEGRGAARRPRASRILSASLLRRIQPGPSTLASRLTRRRQCQKYSPRRRWMAQSRTRYVYPCTGVRVGRIKPHTNTRTIS